MISTLPDLFIGSQSKHTYNDLKLKGNEMLKEAYGMNLKDKVAETLYLGTLPDNNKYVLSKKQLEPELSILFPGKTEVEEYFKDILKA